ncbi:hypothetical protein [Paenibacillus agricola]|uniref:Uncharacterized protein n=1 Tax=Paenibacillus agricola TaxID=2716264 RepID=A0ABX0IZH0_9BACL|nr:hypothetical protein [Paenibacillus agricola]NHN28546.1 hypothetical protein [Paenibacillus agricola]
MGKPLTSTQEKLRDEQIEMNEKYINLINKLLNEFTGFVKNSEEYSSFLVQVYEKLDRAHSMVLQGEFADYYTKNFLPTSSPLFLFYGGINEDFEYLGEEERKNLTKNLPKRTDYIKELAYFKEKIIELVDNIVASNSFIIRFESMDSFYKELYSLSKNNWVYPRETARNSVLGNRQFISPLALHGVPVINPFHIDLYLNFAPEFLTATVLKGKLTKLRTQLKAINANLPFAELCEVVPHIQNIVKGIDTSTSIGSNTSIGSGNAIGDKAVVEGD